MSNAVDRVNSTNRLLSQPPKSGRPPKTLAPQLSSKGHILIVDDAPANLSLLAQILSGEGYEVRVAPTGTLALQSVRSSLPDLILLDIKMPDMDGYELCQRLKLKKATRDIPVIFISDLSQTLEKVKAFRVGGVDYITKPFEPTEILARIKNHLRLRSLRWQLQQQNRQLKSQNAQLQLLVSLTQAISEAPDFDSALEVVLSRVCEAIGWDCGEAWIPNPKELSLQCSRTWPTGEIGPDGSRSCNPKVTFAPKMGLPGRVWFSQEPQWIEGVSQEGEDGCSDCPMTAAGTLQTAFGVPILLDSQVLAVLIFFHPNRLKQNDRLIELVNAVATQLGSLMQRKQAEAELRHSEGKLKEQTQQLLKLLDELQRAHIQLAQNEKMSSLGTLTAGIARELNNPVSLVYSNMTPAIKHSADLLDLLNLYRQYYPKPVPPIEKRIKTIDLDGLNADYPQLLRSIRKGANRISEIVLSLRVFSRLDRDERKQVDLHQGLDSILMLLQSRLQDGKTHRKIEVKREYGQFPLVECYPGQLNQVFMNLLNNAIDALEEGLEDREQATGETIPNPQICIRTQQLSQDRVEICIVDNGIGIPFHLQERVFEPFFTTKPPGKGSGLGLSLGYSIVVEQHQGQLTCHSQPGQGTEFFIELPVKGDTDNSP